MKKQMMIGAMFLMGASAAFAAPMAAKDFVMKAGASDLYEKQSSMLVEKSANPKVRNFAMMMVRDHTKSTADVKAAAMKAGMTPKPPMLDAMQAQNIAALKAASGSARDTLYLDQQKTAHQEALMLHKGYAADGSSPPLKMAAGKIAPVVEHHIAMLDAM